jgi:integrase/recombinase XerD
MKNNRFGTASLISDLEFSKIRKKIETPKYKILLDLAWYTGERWGALVQLQINDVYDENIPREIITFRKNTRKGKISTRQIPIHPNLKEQLSNYAPKDPVWMFPNRDGSKHMTLRHAYNIFMTAVESAGLGGKGISTHSTRRSFITKLHSNGVSTFTISKITGHKDLKSLSHYVEVDDNFMKNAIFAL